MTSLDEMISLPTDLQFKLLSNRLPEAVVMAKVNKIKPSFNNFLSNLFKGLGFQCKKAWRWAQSGFHGKGYVTIYGESITFYTLQYVIQFFSGNKARSDGVQDRRNPEILSDPRCGQEITDREAQIHEPQRPRGQDSLHANRRHPHLWWSGSTSYENPRTVPARSQVDKTKQWKRNNAFFAIFCYCVNLK